MARVRNDQDSDWSDLETFLKAGAKIGKIFIRISGRGTITFNAGFIHQALDKIAGKTHAIFSYSRTKNTIVLEFTDDERKPGAVKMTIRENANATLATRSFFNYFRLEPEQLEGRYVPKLEKIPRRGKCWAINLSEKSQ